MASDAIYNVTHGTVKPWKHTALGLGFASLTGSKLAMQILNRTGHCISYSETLTVNAGVDHRGHEDRGEQTRLNMQWVNPDQATLANVTEFVKAAS